MCQAAAYLDDERIMEDVIWVEPTEGGVLLQTLFDAPTEVSGTLKGIDLLKHRVLITSDQQSQGSETGS